MGKEKYLNKVESLFEKSPVVDFKSISRIVNYKKQVKQYDKQLIKNLISKGKIKRLTKGFYTKYDDPSLAVLCFSPAYLGLHDALSFYGLWEQETIPIIVTTRKVRSGIRKIMGNNVMVRRIDKKYFFGVEYKKIGDFYLPISDIEKTFIDMIYFKEKMNEGILKNFMRKIDKEKLNKYLKKYSKIKMFKEKINILRFFGVLKNVDYKNKEKNIKDFRNSFNRKLRLSKKDKEDLGWMILAEKSMRDVWDNKKDEKIWKEFL